MAPPMAYSQRMVATDADLDPNSYTLEKYCLYETRAVYFTCPFAIYASTLLQSQHHCVQ